MNPHLGIVCHKEREAAVVLDECLQGGQRDGEAEVVPSRLVVGMRFLTATMIPDLFHFPADMAAMDTPINRLFDQVLVRFYDQDWRHVVE